MIYEHKLYLGHNGDSFKISQWLIAALQKHGILGATISNNLGVWRGKTEPQLTLTVIDDASAEIPLRMIAEKYAEEFNQESVLYTRAPLSDVSYITSVKNRTGTPLQTFTK